MLLILAIASIANMAVLPVASAKELNIHKLNDKKLLVG